MVGHRTTKACPPSPGLSRRPSRRASARRRTPPRAADPALPEAATHAVSPRRRPGPILGSVCRGWMPSLPSVVTPGSTRGQSLHRRRLFDGSRLGGRDDTECGTTPTTKPAPQQPSRWARPTTRVSHQAGHPPASPRRRPGPILRSIRRGSTPPPPTGGHPGLDPGPIAPPAQTVRWIPARGPG
jgi:hypothetical protein